MEQAEQVAPLLKALADPVRLRLLSLVASHEGGEACICDLNDAFDLSQPTISHHMKVLHEAGLVDRDKRGVWVYYRVRPRALAGLAALIGCGTGVAARWPCTRRPASRRGTGTHRRTTAVLAWTPSCRSPRPAALPVRRPATVSRGAAGERPPPPGDSTAGPIASTGDAGRRAGHGPGHARRGHAAIRPGPDMTRLWPVQLLGTEPQRAAG